MAISKPPAKADALGRFAAKAATTARASSSARRSILLSLPTELVDQIDDLAKRRFLTVLLPRIFKGTYLELPEVHVTRSRTVRIDADRPFVVYADGDPIGRTPATIEVLPGAITVLCPR